jgi:hypothetical protein
MRAFVKLRQMLATHEDLSRRLEEMESRRIGEALGPAVPRGL